MTDPTDEPGQPEQPQTPPTEPYATAPPPSAPQVPGYGYAPPVPPGMYFDPPSGLVIPNGYVQASPGRRIGAWFLSLLLFVVTLGIGWLIWGAIIWSDGKSPAFQVLGMRCWKPQTNEFAGWGTMALRDIVGRFVEGLLSLISLGASFICFLVTKDHRAFHDYIGGTVVLREVNPAG